MTTFLVEEDRATKETRVVITTEMSTEHGGPLAYVERFMATRVMRRLYAAELAFLAARAAEAAERTD